jgi:cytochrome P450
VTRYDEVVDPALVFTPDELAELHAAGAISSETSARRTPPVDGEDNRRLRRLVAKPCTRRTLAELRPRTADVAIVAPLREPRGARSPAG